MKSYSYLLHLTISYKHSYILLRNIWESSHEVGIQRFLTFEKVLLHLKRYFRNFQDKKYVKRVTR